VQASSLVFCDITFGVANLHCLALELCGEFAFTLLFAIFIGLSVLELLTLLLIGIPLRLLPYIPLYVCMQNLIMRPMRIIALLSELIFIISRRDNYIPQHQR
jgi:hypothetical protein